MIGELKDKRFCDNFQDIYSIYDEICTGYEILLKLFDSMEPKQFSTFAEPFLCSVPQKVYSMHGKIYNKKFVLTYLLGTSQQATNIVNITPNGTETDNICPHSRKIDKYELVFAYRIFKLNYETLINELKNERFRDKFSDICNIYDEICVSYETILQLFDSFEPQEFYAFAESLLEYIPDKVLSMCEKIYNIERIFRVSYILSHRS